MTTSAESHPAFPPHGGTLPRNLLLHFKPETRWSDRVPNRLVSGLTARVPRHPQVAGDAPPASIEELLPAGCARWVVRAAAGSRRSFAERTDAVLNYQTVLPKFLAEQPDLPEF